MPAKTSIKESNKIIDGIIEISDSIGNKSDILKRNAIEKTILVNEKKKPYTASSLVAASVDKELKKIIKDTNKDFKDFVNSMSRYFLNNYSIKLTKADLAAIAKKQSLIVSDLVGNTAILKKDIQKILTQNLAKGISQARLTQELIDLYPAYSRNASTLVNTGISKTFIDANVSKFEQSDFNWYIYAGPNDSVTRENPCSHWVWHKFPASQLQQVTAARMKLWNCRHSIIPITDEEAKDYPLLDIKYAS